MGWTHWRLFYNTYDWVISRDWYTWPDQGQIFWLDVLILKFNVLFLIWQYCVVCYGYAWQYLWIFLWWFVRDVWIVGWLEVCIFVWIDFLMFWMEYWIFLIFFRLINWDYFFIFLLLRKWGFFIICIICIF